MILELLFKALSFLGAIHFASGTCTGNSTTGAQAMLNNWFSGSSAPTLPADWYIALDCGTPTAAGLQYEVSSGANYSRYAAVRNTTNFPTISSGNTMNNGVTFAFAQASGAWTGNSGSNTQVQGAVIMDALTSGAPWWYGMLTTPQTIINTNILQFLANNFSIQQS